VQTTIYHGKEDQYLLDQVDQKAKRERKSRSAVILSILEEHFEGRKRLGEILLDLGALSHSGLAKALDLQRQDRFRDKLLGEILLTEDLADPTAVDRAVSIQARTRR
jgi:replicative superfamily II helicase